MSRNERSALQSYMCMDKNNAFKIECKFIDFFVIVSYNFDSSFTFEVAVAVVQSARAFPLRGCVPANAGRCADGHSSGNRLGSGWDAENTPTGYMYARARFF